MATREAHMNTCLEYPILSLKREGEIALEAHASGTCHNIYTFNNLGSYDLEVDLWTGPRMYQYQFVVQEP